MRIHTFDNTSEAYERTQTDETISDGDLLVVVSENVVGYLLEAWPVAVTEEAGCFHRVVPGDDALVDVRWKYEASIRDAEDVARVVRLLKIERERVVEEDNICEWCGEEGTEGDPVVDVVVAPPVDGYRAEVERMHEKCMCAAAKAMVI